MERKELIKKGADAVRNTPHLFAAYKQFLIEDWGKLPQGCFGCQFSSHFSKWKNQVLTDNIIPMENTVKPTKTYVLKDKSINKYLYGEVYSNYSPDEHWAKYLELKPEGKELFMVLPQGIERTDADQETEEEFKKKELSDLQTTEDVVDDEVPAETESEITKDEVENIASTDTSEDLQTTEDVVETSAEQAVSEVKPKRGRKSQN